MNEIKLADKVTAKAHDDSISFFCYSDIEEVAQLSQKYFPESRNVPLKSLNKTLQLLYFEKGNHLKSSSTLVSRSVDGTVDGFLGVITRSFRYKNRIINVANCHHLMATEQARSKLLPIKMLQKFLSGPQDLSFADNSSETTRLLWKRLGGEPAISDCIYYKVPLRPISFALRPVLKFMNKPVQKAVALLAKGSDMLASRVHIPLFYRNKTGAELRPLSAQLLNDSLAKISSQYFLFPHFDPAKIERLFLLLSREKRYGILHKYIITDENSELAGWFIYYSKKGGVCEVIQAVCMPGKETLLFDTLTRHAYMQGGIELSGRLMPNQLQSPIARRAVCIPARMWTLFHTRNAELMLDIQTGKAFFSRLEGDLWLI